MGGAATGGAACCVCCGAGGAAVRVGLCSLCDVGILNFFNGVTDSVDFRSQAVSLLSDVPNRFCKSCLLVSQWLL